MKKQAFAAFLITTILVLIVSLSISVPALAQAPAPTPTPIVEVLTTPAPVVTAPALEVPDFKALGLRFLSDTITAFMMLFGPAVAVMFAKFLWDLARYALQWLKIKNPLLGDLIEEAANRAVEAAEKLGVKKLIDDKKSYALAAAQAWLKARGLTVDVMAIDMEIERAVERLFPHEELPPPAEGLDAQPADLITDNPGTAG